jgi:hypothetical protein
MEKARGSAETPLETHGVVWQKTTSLLVTSVKTSNLKIIILGGLGNYQTSWNEAVRFKF